MDVAGRVALRFTGDVVRGGSHDNLTAVRADGEHLWVAGDETATIDRLVLDSATAPTRAGRQRSFRLADLVQLPGPPDGETDLQGWPAAAGGCGRSGRTRWCAAGPSRSTTTRRWSAGSASCGATRTGSSSCGSPCSWASTATPSRCASPATAAARRWSAPRMRRPWSTCCAPTPHLAPFLAIPGQDNGFDVGGLAVVGDRLYVGLRGPVLRGWAVVLEVRPAQDPTDPGRLALGIFPEGVRYRKHVLDLGGLGRPRPVPGRRRPAGAGGPDDGAVGAGAGAPVAGRGRRRRWAGGARRRAAGRDGGAQRGGRRPRLGDLAARPGPARPGRAAAGGLRRPGGGPQAVAGHGAGRPGADRRVERRRRRGARAQDAVDVERRRTRPRAGRPRRRRHGPAADRSRRRPAVEDTVDDSRTPPRSPTSRTTSRDPDDEPTPQPPRSTSRTGISPSTAARPPSCSRTGARTFGTLVRCGGRPLPANITAPSANTAPRDRPRS